MSRRKIEQPMKAEKPIEQLRKISVVGAQKAPAYLGLAAAIDVDGVQIILVAPDIKSLNHISRCLNVRINRLDSSAVKPVAVIHENALNREDGDDF